MNFEEIFIRNWKHKGNYFEILNIRVLYYDTEEDNLDRKKHK